MEQKLYFKHLYLAMIYSVFTLACFQDSKLQDKIDYTASYALFQEHTLSFHLHLDQDARFSLHDIKKSFYTKKLKRIQRNEASKESNVEKSELGFDFDFLAMIGGIGDYNPKKQQEASEFIIGKLEEHLGLKDNGKRFNITKHLFAAVYHHRGES